MAEPAPGQPNPNPNPNPVPDPNPNPDPEPRTRQLRGNAAAAAPPSDVEWLHPLTLEEMEQVAKKLEKRQQDPEAPAAAARDSGGAKN
mmetsp:Transcript_30361/g.96894  ORF Transcript_30361/g.96894 Transcript_30361/m.96894 type:complete len:88 (+) Transcript_30361:44-307(+)